LVEKVNDEFRQIFPSPGLVELNLNDIFVSVMLSVLDVKGFK
jgi:glycerol kinase